jgi:hypothetical protein
MAISNISDVFSGATVSSFNITIPSGSLTSCALPSSGNPTEIIFGMLENIHQSIQDNDPTYISSNAVSVLADPTTYRRVYNFTVDLNFDNNTILELLDVKSEPVV